jgi:hypothetical protein
MRTIPTTFRKPLPRPDWPLRIDRILRMVPPTNVIRATVR